MNSVLLVDGLLHSQRKKPRLDSLKNPFDISPRVRGRKSPPVVSFFERCAKHAGSRAQLPSSWQLLPAAQEKSFSGKARVKVRTKTWLRILASRGRGYQGHGDTAQLAPGRWWPGKIEAQLKVFSNFIPDSTNFTSMIEVADIGVPTSLVPRLSWRRCVLVAI